MSKQDTESIEGLRDIFDFRNNYDVVLACAFEPEEKGDTKFELYNRIGWAVKNVGKRPYLPHNELDLDWPPGKIYSIPNNIVIPTADVILGYIGLPSLATGVMIGSAIKSDLPMIWLYESEQDFEGLKVIIDKISLDDKMKDRGIFDTRDQVREFDSLNICNGNLKNLEDSLNRFYQTK